MDTIYINKYLKYKKKYIKLKKLKGGTNKLISVFTLETNSNIFHGTFNKVVGNINPPAFYSTDPLQSIGHLISTASKMQNIEEYNEKDFLKISTCYPFIYIYKNTRPLKLLQMKVSQSTYNETFEIIFNKTIIKKYLDKLDNKIDVLTSFFNKLEKIGVDLKGITVINDKNFDDNFNNLMVSYSKTCEISCFGGWANTPGYYLLTSIDYKAYFKEILKDIVSEDIDIDGIYVDRDQDEIILFDNLGLTTTPQIQYILPYTFKDADSEEIKCFINKYINASNNFISDQKNETYKIQLKELFIQFNEIDSSNKWNFDWFQVFCKNFDPYQDMNQYGTDSEKCELINSQNKQKDACIKRYPINPSNIGLKEDYNAYEYFDCDNEYFHSSKISILDIKTHSDTLKMWISTILSDNFSDSRLKIFDSICNNRTIMLDRTI